MDFNFSFNILHQILSLKFLNELMSFNVIGMDGIYSKKKIDKKI